MLTERERACAPETPLAELLALAPRWPAEVAAHPALLFCALAEPDTFARVPPAVADALLGRPELPDALLALGWPRPRTLAAALRLALPPASSDNQLRGRQWLRVDPSGPLRPDDLASAERWHQRRLAIALPDVSPATLGRLSFDIHPAVRRAAARHPRFPDDTRALLDRAGAGPELYEPAQRPAAAGPGPLPPEDQRALWKRGGFGRILLAAHPRTRPQLLLNLARAQDARPLPWLARRPELSGALLRRLLQRHELPFCLPLDAHPELRRQLLLQEANRYRTGGRLPARWASTLAPHARARPAWLPREWTTLAEELGPRLLVRRLPLPTAALDLLEGQRLSRAQRSLLDDLRARPPRPPTPLPPETDWLALLAGPPIDRDRLAQVPRALVLAHGRDEHLDVLAR